MKLGAMIYSFAAAMDSGQMTQRDAIRLCADLGLVGIDTTEGIGGDPWTEVRKMADDADLRVATHIVVTPLTALDKAEHQRAMDMIRTAVDDAITLGAGIVMAVTGPIQTDDTREAAQRRIGESFARLIDKTRDAGIRFCIEDFPGETSPHRTSAELLAVCDIAGPEFGLCFDSGNFYCGGESPETAWPRLRDKVIHCHLKDWRWTDGETGHPTPDGRRLTPELVGQGIIDYPALLAMIKRSGYEGVLSFEYEGPRDRADAAGEGVEYLRSVWDNA